MLCVKLQNEVCRSDGLNVLFTSIFQFFGEGPSLRGGWIEHAFSSNFVFFGEGGWVEGVKFGGRGLSIGFLQMSIGSQIVSLQTAKMSPTNDQMHVVRECKYKYKYNPKKRDQLMIKCTQSEHAGLLSSSGQFDGSEL